MEMEPDPSDTMDNPIDTMVMDTMDIDTMDNGMPCDPDVVYFEKDVLPLFLGNCAFSGCHDAATASDGVVLDNYDDIINTGEIKAFDLNESKVYEVITEDDEDKVMPPGDKLDNELINLIATWILQGAENLDCDEEMEPCDTVDVSYSGFVADVFQMHCNGCHGTGVANGGVITDNYNDVKEAVDSGRLFGALNWDDGFSNMPQGQDQLDQCILDKIKSWIDAGAENN